ncbi:MAG: LysR family transcriptional regulator [Rhodospirillales bacterium]|nr:LysR family transcriptional regulator [Rhodospirillales bacterium]
MDWDKLRIFYAVAKAESFTHAGDTLNLSQSAVSRQISALEGSLNVSLFHRHARGLKLTEQGVHLFRTVKDVYNKLTMTEAQIIESKERPQGPLKITTTVAFGSVWLTPRMKEFLEHYPDIEVSLVLSDSDLDLSMGEADAAIKMGAPTQPDLIQRNIMPIGFNVFASPQYLKANGIPEKPEDMDDHKLIVYGEDVWAPVANLNWLLDAGATPENPRQAVLRVNSVYGIYRAVQSGIGIGALPDYMSHQLANANLVQVLSELKGPNFDAYFVYPEELRNSKRIEVFRDFLLRRIAEDGN